MKDNFEFLSTDKCPVCRTNIEPDAVKATCPVCMVTYHQNCWVANGKQCCVCGAAGDASRTNNPAPATPDGEAALLKDQKTRLGPDMPEKPGGGQPDGRFVSPESGKVLMTAYEIALHRSGDMPAPTARKQPGEQERPAAGLDKPGFRIKPFIVFLLLYGFMFSQVGVQFKQAKVDIPPIGYSLMLALVTTCFVWSLAALVKPATASFGLLDSRMKAFGLFAGLTALSFIILCAFP